MPVKLLVGTCSSSKRKKSFTVSDQTIAAEGLGDFFKHIDKAANNFGNKLKSHLRALELATTIGTADASKDPRMIVATDPDNLEFVHQGNGLYLGKVK